VRGLYTEEQDVELENSVRWDAPWYADLSIAKMRIDADETLAVLVVALGQI